MRKAGEKSSQRIGERDRTSPGGIFLLVFTVASLILTFGCSSGNTNFIAPTLQNPTPGVTLQKIKITPTSSIILLAESRQLFAMGTYSDGTTTDISSSVTWGTSSGSGANVVTVNSSGIATANAIGASAVTATIGSVQGVLQLVVGTNGFSSSTMSVLSVQPKTSEIDVGYLPQPTMINGAYAVQEVNLDADQSSNLLPVPAALIASIAMPAGYIPNATAASPNNSLVAVISYSSPAIQIIDASNNPLDLSSNTIIAAYQAPVSQSVTINGTSCMICAAVVNPLNSQLILSTAEGFYSMNMTTGAFNKIAFAPAPAPTANITLDPVATPDPFILSAVPSAAEIQVLDLTTDVVTTYPNLGVAPTAAAIDPITQFSAVVDGNTSDQTLIDFTQSQSPVISTEAGVGFCSGGSPYMNMASLGVSASATATGASHYLLTGQTGGSCIGVAQWPIGGAAAGTSLSPANISYGYGTLPTAPDGSSFVVGTDPNAIATFTSVVDKNLYGVLIGGDQQWLAKINFGTVASQANLGIPNNPLPGGGDISPNLTAGSVSSTMVFLPTPSTQLTISQTNLNFGTVTVGTPGPQLNVSLNNISTAAVLLPQISLQGPNAGDFSLFANCGGGVAVQPLSNCGLSVTFSPAATGTRSAMLSVTIPGLPSQSIPLSGTGQ